MDACNEMNKVTVIDSTFVNDIKKSYYSLLQGFIFVFNIDIILNEKYKDEIGFVYNKVKESVKEELISVIALKRTKSQEIVDLKNESIIQKIDHISHEFKSKIFIFSIETGENIQNMFYFIS